jgi:hypothetical protein
VPIASAARENDRFNAVLGQSGDQFDERAADSPALLCLEYLIIESDPEPGRARSG